MLQVSAIRMIRWMAKMCRYSFLHVLFPRLVLWYFLRSGCLKIRQWLGMLERSMKILKNKMQDTKFLQHRLENYNFICTLDYFIGVRIDLGEANPRRIPVAISDALLFRPFELQHNLGNIFELLGIRTSMQNTFRLLAIEALLSRTLLWAVDRLRRWSCISSLIMISRTGRCSTMVVAMKFCVAGFACFRMEWSFLRADGKEVKCLMQRRSTTTRFFYE